MTYGTTVNTADVKVNNLTYQNQVTPVSTVSTSLGDYYVDGALASSVYIRRNTSSGNANNTTMYYTYSSGGYSTATVIGGADSTPTLSEALLSGDLNQGVCNPFANTGNYTSNIERIDYFFSGGYTVKEGDAIILFDMEDPGDHGDGFRISAFTSVGTVNGTSNAPTAYANAGLLVNPGTMGDAIATPDGNNDRYLFSTTTNGNNLTGSQSITSIDYNTGTPGADDLYLVGIVIRFTDLGLSVGQTIYGYSLMAGDVTATTSSDLVNWNNSSVYLTDTASSTWGNVDLAGFGAQMARPVPEVHFYGFSVVAVLLTLQFARKHINRFLLKR